jgi:hypothetical protein
MRSWSTNHWRTVFSLLVPALPEPREAAPVSRTTAARPVVVEAGVHVLHPAPVGGGFAGEAGPGGEAVEFVGVVVGLGEPVLVPHGIGDDAVEGAEFARFAELGVLEGVADLDLALHVVDDHVHVGHGPGLGDVLLAVELERGAVRFLPQARFSSMAISHLMSRPPEPQVGS